MSRSIHRSLGAGALIALSLIAFDAPGQNTPTPVEIVQLPRFCWAPFRVPGAKGEEFDIRGCSNANHYCYALMYILRAKQPGLNKRVRGDLLVRAENDIRYTEGGLNATPYCSIRDHVAATKAEVARLRAIYGLGPSSLK